MLKEEISNWLMNLQDSICNALETADGSARFIEDKWDREEGGGGRTRIISDGKVLEKGGVAFSAVHGKTPSFLTNEKDHAVTGKIKTDSSFFATGVSIVIHPQNPHVPIIHMNVRYFETSDGVKWLGGGIDLTPHFINLNDARFFHETLKKVCDRHDPSYYPKYKDWADEYFFIKHRNETRGIGGIFFDRISSENEKEFGKQLEFWKDVGLSFALIYVELINRNKNKSYTDAEKNWQLIRRGRYVEFNLVYDKGTKFGLETNGRIESILMSLPKFASWQYNYKAQENTEEANTIKYLKKGIDFLTL